MSKWKERNRDREPKIWYCWKYKNFWNLPKCVYLILNMLSRKSENPIDDSPIYGLGYTILYARHHNFWFISCLRSECCTLTKSHLVKYTVFRLGYTGSQPWSLTNNLKKLETETVEMDTTAVNNIQIMSSTHFVSNIEPTEIIIAKVWYLVHFKIFHRKSDWF